MSLLPLRTVTLLSDLDPSALAGALCREVGEDPRLPFTGSVAGERFVITRLREFRSTFMPVLRGSLAPAPGGGTRVLLRLAPPGVVVLFMAIWLGFLAAVAAMIVAARALGADRSALWLLGPAGLAGLSWHLMASVFAADAHWALEHLLGRLAHLRREPPGEPRSARTRGSSSASARCARIRGGRGN
jgi:hypothetical protein